MISTLQDRVNGDAALVRRGRWLNADMLLEIGDASHLVRIRSGKIEEVEHVALRVAGYDFAIRGPEDAWTEFWQPIPKPMHHDLIALIRLGKMRIEGNLEMAMAHLLTLKLMLEKPRGVGGVQ